MKRLSLTLSAQVEAFRQNALCSKCFKPFAGDVQFDHEIPLGLNGKDHNERALVPLHKQCHALKTKADVTRIAKAERQGLRKGQQARRNRRDAPLIKSRGFAGHKKFDGTPVWKK